MNDLKPATASSPVGRWPKKILNGRVIADQDPVVRGLSMTAIVLAIVAWLSTLGLAFMLGRASVEQAPQVGAAPVSSPAPAPSPVAISKQDALPPKVKPTPSFPQFASTVPSAFRGSWDEIVTDGCDGREARYMIGATTFSNFEVQADVERVKLLSPTKIELSVTGYDEDKNQFNSKIGFRLVDGGKALAGLDEGSNIYRKCP